MTDPRATALGRVMGLLVAVTISRHALAAVQSPSGSWSQERVEGITAAVGMNVALLTIFSWLATEALRGRRARAAAGATLLLSALLIADPLLSHFVFEFEGAPWFAIVQIVVALIAAAAIVIAMRALAR